MSRLRDRKREEEIQEPETKLEIVSEEEKHEEEIQETEGNAANSLNGSDPVHETSKEKKVEQNNAPVITNKIKPEEIAPPTKKKIYDDVALLGNTIECRDFRAICKKNNWTIKDKLTEIISKWNGVNYNI